MSSGSRSRRQSNNDASLRSNSSMCISKPNWLVRSFRSVFGYRKTTLTFLVFLTIFLSTVLSYLDRSLEWSVSLPSSHHERQLLDQSWLHLQTIATNEHTYTSPGNDVVHDYILKEVYKLVSLKNYMESDNDLNNTNTVMIGADVFGLYQVAYYESNNIVARINGSNPQLPALLLSAHFDSVPSSFGATDDGMGIASLLGVLSHYAHNDTQQPQRTIIFNFNNNEEFGLYGAHAFLNHPWSLQVNYFLNLEGTGAGGKAVLFRGTDYGTVKFYNNVRYPFATSSFQQGFNNKLIHSDTDYTVYKDKGNLRGIDVAFYRPRDFYHTAEDNLRNINNKSLWHMLSTALDYTEAIVSGRIDLDDEDSSGSSSGSSNSDFASFSSFHNMFFAIPIGQLIVVNIVLLVVTPLVAIPLLFFIGHFKKQWNFNFANAIKLPLSFIFSSVVLNFLTDIVIIPMNPFLINNSEGTLIAALFSLFLLVNYGFLNGFNFVFKSFKGHFHDEKLISLLETSLLFWVALLFTTYKLSNNKIGDDHTGEHIITALFVVQAVGVLFGLLGWMFKRSHKKAPSSPENQPLLNREHENQNDSQYGTNGEEDHEHSGAESSSMSLSSQNSSNCEEEQPKSFSYDWLIQFLIVAPLSSLIIFNTGFLVLEGSRKAIQESLFSQNMVYLLLQSFIVAWTIPFLPFVFKLNRIIVVVLIIGLLQGLFVVNTRSPFDRENPLKLRFLQTVDLDAKPVTSDVGVFGRDIDIIKDILNDLPSVKKNHGHVKKETLGDGILRYSFPGILPRVQSNVSNPHDYVDVKVLRNSSSGANAPFGLFQGELEIRAPKNRNCKINFNVTDSLTKIMGNDEKKKSPVKTFIVYNDGHDKGFSVERTPEGFSRDSKGNYVFKDSEGIDEVFLNKLDWDKTYHVAFQWVPEFFELANDADESEVNVRKLGVKVECYWSDLAPLATGNNGGVEERIPAYEEVLKFTPNYVSWANRDRGLVSVRKFVEV